MFRILLLLVALSICYATLAQAPRFKIVHSPTTEGGSKVVFNGAYTNYATDYFVQKKDGTGFITTSKIHVDNSGKQYLEYKEDGSKEVKRVYPNETLNISYEDKQKGKRIQGTTWDSCWLFKLVEGNITLYSNYPPPVELVNEVIFAMKVGEAPIELFNPGKLRVAVESNKQATEAFDKKFWQNNYIKAAQKFNKE